MHATHLPPGAVNRYRRIGSYAVRKSTPARRVGPSGVSESAVWDGIGVSAATRCVTCDSIVQRGVVTIARRVGVPGRRCRAPSFAAASGSSAASRPIAANT